MKKLFTISIAVASLLVSSPSSADLVRDAEASQAMLKEFGFAYAPHREGMSDWKCNVALRPSADKPMRGVCAVDDNRKIFHARFLIFSPEVQKEEQQRRARDFAFTANNVTASYSIKSSESETLDVKGVAVEITHYQVWLHDFQYGPYLSVATFTLPGRPLRFAVMASNGKSREGAKATPIREEMRELLRSLHFQAE